MTLRSESNRADRRAFARGEIVVVVDDEDRENEGDLIMAAEKITPEKIGVHGPPHERRDLRADARASGSTSSSSR